MQKLENKVALITGGTSGIGFSTAQEFLSQGAKVIITGRRKESVNQAVKRLGKNAYGIASDAGKLPDIFELQQNIKAFTNELDILFINAGYAKFAPIERVSEGQFDELFNVLVKGTFFTVQQLLPMMNENGSIILNTSVVTEIGYSNMSVYSAAKSAIQSFIKTFSAECVGHNIRVNGISPGYINTKGFEKTGLTDEQIKGIIASVIPTLPFKRFGEPSEVGKTVAFLASDDASYIHGTEITIDGGLSNIKQ